MLFICINKVVGCNIFKIHKYKIPLHDTERKLSCMNVFYQIVSVGNTWMFEMKLQTVIEHKETKYDILHVSLYWQVYQTVVKHFDT